MRVIKLLQQVQEKQIILRKPDDYESVYKAAQLSKKLGEPEKAKMYLTCSMSI